MGKKSENANRVGSFIWHLRVLKSVDNQKSAHFKLKLFAILLSIQITVSVKILIMENTDLIKNEFLPDIWGIFLF